jgi:hypothetical protein
MDAAKAEDEERAAARRPDEEARGGTPPADSELEEALLRRLERIAVLARKRDEPAPHGELLDELRGLVRAAEELRPLPTETEEEVVERPARRLHGT